ncbi:s-phase kinase-associated protein 1 [Xylaria bambusicola]|uniref:s-phase kinase-associated protein 1 n=1 Tax=Xylaria bambusicola TaxID=326684 RepID=UPI00200889C8|nr:s-phase kinase-associated protein 1 [Xylaria bambusicola]KAI0508582.1 s-phase kinase-associated protein 1 [Xylaria bambusicola]
MESTPLKVTLASNDGVEVQATLAAVKQSTTLSTMFEVLDESKTTNLPVPIPGVDGETLRVVMEWCEEYQHVTEADNSLKLGNGATKIPEWSNVFLTKVGLDRDLFFKLINAANYLEIQPLLRYSILKLARKLEMMNPEQMREYLHIENDFSPEEEAELKRSHAWAMQREPEKLEPEQQQPQ